MLQKRARASIRDAGVARPKRAGLRFGDDKLPGEIGRSLPERGREQDRLVGQPPGLADD